MSTALDLNDDGDDAAGGDRVTIPERVRRLRVALALLPDEEHALIEARYFESAEWREVAERLGSTVRDVLKMHEAALGRLRRLVG